MVYFIFMKLQDTYASIHSLQFLSLSVGLEIRNHVPGFFVFFFPEVKLTKSDCQSLGSLFITFGWKGNIGTRVTEGAGISLGLKIQETME